MKDFLAKKKGFMVDVMSIPKTLGIPNEVRTSPAKIE